MAQATVSSTDELLSQLAASEIDRLLSEADAKEMPPAPQEAPAPPPPVVEVINGIKRTETQFSAHGEAKP